MLTDSIEIFTVDHRVEHLPLALHKERFRSSGFVRATPRSMAQDVAYPRRLPEVAEQVFEPGDSRVRVFLGRSRQLVNQSDQRVRQRLFQSLRFLEPCFKSLVRLRRSMLLPYSERENGFAQHLFKEPVRRDRASQLLPKYRFMPVSRKVRWQSVQVHQHSQTTSPFLRKTSLPADHRNADGSRQGNAVRAPGASISRPLRRRAAKSS